MPPPLVAAETGARGRRITAVDAAAERLGLFPGLALADARARLPDLDVVEADAAADRAALLAVAAFAERWTPMVAPAGRRGLLIDATGCAHLFGGEAAMLDDVGARIGALGFTVRRALAGTPLAACALARRRDGLLVPEGGEAEAVRDLPIAALGLDEGVRNSLTRLGLDRVGALAALPRAALAARFGADLLARLDEITGARDAPLSPLRPVPLHVAERRFADPMADPGTALRVLADLARELCRMLERRGTGCRRLEAVFFRSDGGVRRLQAATARPTRDAAHLGHLFAERLAALADPLDPGFGFDMIRLAVLEADPLHEVQASLGTSLDGPPAADDLAPLVDVLCARFGADRVMRFAAGDTHIPEAAAIAVPAQRAMDAPVPAVAGWPPPAGPDLPPARPLTLFDRPEPVETLAEVPDGPPLRFRWRRAMHEVAHAEGPERIAPEWWTGTTGLTRDYFRVEDHAGLRFWLYREGIYGRETARSRWFVHGLFA